MANPSLEELDERIAIVRDNIRELTEQAAALSGAQDEALIADRIADQERLLAELLKEREKLIASVRPSRT
jgi:predicted ATPase